MRFAGKVVIVTGAGSGIGAATAVRFANEGARLVLVGRGEDKLKSTAAAMRPDQVLVVAGDLTDEPFVFSVAERAITAFGRLDVLINNAGVFEGGTVSNSSTAHWRRVISSNLDTAYLMSRAAIPHLRPTRGAIVNTSSVSGIRGEWGAAAYVTAKGGLNNLTRAMALDLARDGIRVNSVCPTLTATPMTAGIADRPERLARFHERIPLGRIADPREIAAAVTFLASDDASFITGVNLPVDGGTSASNGEPSPL